jgi:hypothetical protein
VDQLPTCPTCGSAAVDSFPAGAGHTAACISCGDTWPMTTVQAHEYQAWISRGRHCPMCGAAGAALFGAGSERSGFCPACGQSWRTVCAGDDTTAAEPRQPSSAERFGREMFRPRTLLAGVGFASVLLVLAIVYDRFVDLAAVYLASALLNAAIFTAGPRLLARLTTAPGNQ